MNKKIQDLEIFKDYLSTFKECSYDNTNKINLVESEEISVDFDKFTIEYFKNIKIDRQPSNDSLYQSEDGTLYFIEFKNSDLNTLNSKKMKLISKIVHSFLILFGQELDFKIQDFKDSGEYILVYSKSKNNNGIKSITNSLNYYSKLGLNIFKGYCFKDIKIMDNEKFDKKFITK